MSSKASEVRLEGVGKRFGETWAVRGVSLHVRAGEFYTFLGPSGCGKTTLLRMIAGFAAPDEGGVWLDDTMVNALPPWKRDVGMVFQSYAIWPHMTVFENVAFGLRERRVSRADIERQVGEALRMVNLEGMEGEGVDFYTPVESPSPEEGNPAKRDDPRQPVAEQDWPKLPRNDKKKLAKSSFV
ncbi:MAG: ABC transporter ATP-binding protein, partial [candidate division NC10 bacterium]|nr:ABC transporter ATP-binding protein [candidate division NC10 bacterium]